MTVTAKDQLGTTLNALKGQAQEQGGSHTTTNLAVGGGLKIGGLKAFSNMDSSLKINTGGGGIGLNRPTQPKLQL